jgi:5-methylcytosine-specific restriction endonuclease McrA
MLEKYTRAKDRMGRDILKTAHGDTGSKFGWNIHHKIPKRRGGTNAFENLEIAHIQTHDEIHGG